MPSPNYPPSDRLRRDAEFKQVLVNGRIYPGRECLVRILPNDTGQARLGIGSPRRYGNAVRRNRFRRLVREAFRRLRPELDALDVLVTPRKGLVHPTLEGLVRDLQDAPRLAHTARPFKRRERGSKKGRA